MRRQFTLSPQIHSSAFALVYRLRCERLFGSKPNVAHRPQSSLAASPAGGHDSHLLHCAGYSDYPRMRPSRAAIETCTQILRAAARHRVALRSHHFPFHPYLQFQRYAHLNNTGPFDRSRDECERSGGGSEILHLSFYPGCRRCVQCLLRLQRICVNC